MRTLLFIGLALTLACCTPRGPRRTNAPAADGYTHTVDLDAAKASASIALDTIKLGRLNPDEITAFRVGIRNTGGEPMIILDARGTCGCTEVDYPKDPVLPGATADLVLRYDSGGQSGSQFKSVRLYTSLDAQPYPLLITATVGE